MDNRVITREEGGKRRLTRVKGVKHILTEGDYTLKGKHTM